MKRKDYKCQECGNVDEFWGEDTCVFPEYIPCTKCSNRAKKTFAPTPSIVHQGKAGNYKNGYVSSPVAIKKS